MTINFTGKELVAKEVAERYFNPRNPITELPTKVAKKVSEQLPQANKGMVESYANSHAPIPLNPPSADKIAEAYRAAHGIV